MNFKVCNRRPGFTIIELMVSIFITLTVVGTFYKLYTNSVKTQRNTAVRASVNILGEQMMETIASSIRLLGLTSDNLEFVPAVNTPGTIIFDANGSDGIDNASFRYASPYGGPITKLSLPAGGDNGACTLTIINSAALHAGIGTVNLVSRTGIYSATVASVTGNVIVTSAMTPAIAGTCASFFPEGTLLTGPENDFQLTYVNGGANTILTLIGNLPDGTTETYVNFNSDNNPAYQMPYFVLQFLREYDDGSGTGIKREWFSNIDEDVTPSDIRDIRAVRIGFVLLSDVDRVKKKVATADAGITTQHCPFDLMCYSLTDQNKTAYVFKRVIHIKNYDYLSINAGINHR